MRLIRYGIGVLLVVLWAMPLHAQEPTGTIRGRVTDEATKRPLQGGTVLIGNRSAVSQADGRYVIVGVPAGTDTLRTRMIGYTPAAIEVTVAGGEIVDVDINLTAQAVNLSEMVVVGYGEQRAGDITGAVTNVTPEEFNTGRIVTPTELIQNKVAGVQVVESNEPGGTTSIRIRGPTSTTASSDPLVVIDGVPLGTGSGSGIAGGRDPLNFVNSADIESITVLRDASAAAIYGTNAANGVVLITTKRGRQGDGPKFEYSGTVSASSVTRLPTMLNATQFRAAVLAHADTARSNQLLNANTNWFDQVDRTAYGQEQNFAISGAGGSMDYRLSANYLRPKRHYRWHQHQARHPGSQLQPAALQRPLEPEVQCARLARKRPVYSWGRALQRRPDGTDATDQGSDERDRLLQLAKAGRHPVGGQPGRDSEAGAR